MSANLRNRLKELQEMKSSATMRRRFMMSDKETIEEPTYDIKALDKKCVEIHNALFEIDKSVKESNAKTEIDLKVEYSQLMEAIQ
jgi:hypothetical protein